VTSGNMIRNQQRGEYLRYDLKDPMNPHIGYPAQTSFNAGVIADFKAVLPKNRGGDLPDDDAWTEEKIPMSLRVFPGAIDVTYDLHGEYCMTYSEDIIDEAGNTIPGKAKGDIVCGQNGLPKVYTSIPIVCAQGYEMEDIWNDQKMDWEYNEDGTKKQRPTRDANGNYKRTWLRGYSPEEVGDGRKAMMIPFTEALKQKFNVKPEVADAEEITEDEAALFAGPGAAAEAPAATPAATPAAAPAAGAAATA